MVSGKWRDADIGLRCWPNACDESTRPFRSFNYGLKVVDTGIKRIPTPAAARPVLAGFRMATADMALSPTPGQLPRPELREQGSSRTLRATGGTRSLPTD